MKKLKFILIISMTTFIISISGTQSTAVNLPTWELKINSDILLLNNLDRPGLASYLTEYDDMNGTNYSTLVDLRAFDLSTNLGEIAITTAPGFSGVYYVSGFFDYDFSAASMNSETGSGFGFPVAGQTWEINYIDYVNDSTGIHSNFSDGTLRGLNGITDPGDIAMALGWSVLVNPGEVATVRLVVSSSQPDSGPYLTQTNSAGNRIYYSGGVAAVPEPATLLLLGSGLIALAGLGRKKLLNPKHMV
jgi:hypothetical protein